MNEKIRNFKKYCEKEYIRIVEKTILQTEDFIEEIKKMDFGIFSYANPFHGEEKNKIFFTYSDCYKHNSPLSMSCCELHHPHTFIDDRGYIKGVCVDLSTYLQLRKIGNFTGHNFHVILDCFFPKFRKTKKHEENVLFCKKIHEQFAKKLDELIEKERAKINDTLKECTGCSLLYYLRQI